MNKKQKITALKKQFVAKTWQNACTTPYFVHAAIVDFYIFRHILKHKPTIFIYIQTIYIGHVEGNKTFFSFCLRSAFCFSTSPKAPCWRFPILAMTMYEKVRHCSFGLTKTFFSFLEKCVFSPSQCTSKLDIVHLA